MDQLLTCSPHDVSRANRIQAKIDAGWLARTPPINHDVIYLIFECFKPPRVFTAYDLQRADEERIRLDCLSNLCRISKEWLGRGRTSLYHDLVKGNHDQVDQICHTLYETPSLAALVRRVAVGRWTGGWRIGDDLHIMPNLTEVWILERLAGLRVLDVPTLKRVMFSQSSDFYGWYDAPSCWPELEALTVSDDLPDDLSAPFASLKTLKITSSSVSIPEIQAVASINLRTLELRHVEFEDAEVFLGELLTHYSALECLEIISCSHRSPNRVLLLLAPAPSLGCFRVHNTNFGLADPSQLPTNLVEIKIEWRNCNQSSVLSFIQKRQGTLRSFTLVGMIDSDEWEAVAEVAYGLGVMFEVTDKVSRDSDLDSR